MKWLATFTKIHMCSDNITKKQKGRADKKLSVKLFRLLSQTETRTERYSLLSVYTDRVWSILIRYIGFHSTIMMTLLLR